MAGGSSDAAAALRLIARASGLTIPPQLPMQLGADVTVMLYAQRALMTGAGEHVEALPADKPPLIVVPLDAELSAGQVYARVRRARHRRARPRSSRPPRSGSAPASRSSTSTTSSPPPAGCARRSTPRSRRCATSACEHPMVTGSGPTVFGISDDPEAVRELHAAGYPRAVAA